MRRVKHLLVAVAVAAVESLGVQGAAAKGFDADGVVYDQPGQARLYVRPGGSVVYDEPGVTRLYLASGDNGTTTSSAVRPAVSNSPDANAAQPAVAESDGPKAADGTPMFLANGSPNLDFYRTAKGYRSPEGYLESRWGMSRSEVSRLFPKAQPEQAMLAYASETAGLKTLHVFMFVDDALSAVSILSDELRSTGDQYLADYEKLHSLLVRKYGKPRTTSETWSSEFLRGTMSKGASLQIGFVKLSSTWMTGETNIQIRAEAMGARVRVQVVYASARLMVKQADDLAQKDMQGL
ncbi:hypothetical protein [Corallococcus sp. 4LFB]|uniref:hypothetical protein n=1 Tax=Corallococcus sp. 4LFB TaxID=3383249 RepID=UPI003976A771